MSYVPPTREEAREKTVRAFRQGADYVFADSRRQRWVVDAAALMVQDGLLKEGELVEIDEQYSQMRWYPTEKLTALVQTKETP